MKAHQDIDKTLFEQLNFSDREISTRKQLLMFTNADDKVLEKYSSVVSEKIHDIVSEFYEHQTSIEEVALIIGDADTLARLKKVQKDYIEDLFNAVIDYEYVNKRLRIGLVHKRIGVTPKLYLAAVQALFRIIMDNIREDIQDADLAPLESALQKLMNFDMALAFDAYISSMSSELVSAKSSAEKLAKKAEELSNIDKLTGLMTRNRLDTFLKRLYAHAKRAMEPITAMVIDLNMFKDINDEFGHAKGDEVLATLGQIILENSREDIDIACRTGGDEFLLVLSGCKATDAEIIRDRLLESFKKAYPDFAFSTGIADTGPEEFLSIDELMANADKDMYKNKRSNTERGSDKSG